MHLHPPKAPHSWSEFLREVGVIAVGILLALGAEQVIEALHWRERVEIAEGGIKDELRGSAMHAYERLVVQPCLHGQIELLATRLADPGAHWTNARMRFDNPDYHPAIASPYIAPTRAFTDDQWQNAKSSGTIGHMPAARVAAISELYYTVNSFNQLQEKEASAASPLAVLARDGEVPAAARSDLLGSLAEVDRINELLVAYARALLGNLKATGRHYSAAEVEVDRKDIVKYERATRGSCVADLPLDLG